MAAAHSIQGIIICSIFMLIGPALIMVNQYILKALHFPYPIFLSGLGVVASYLTAKILVVFGYVKVQRSDAIDGWLYYKRVLPVGLCTAATLSFGNMVYLYLDVGFIQMLKSFTPVILLFTGYMAGIDSATWPTIVAVTIISIGTATTCSYSPQLHLLGLIFMFLSSLTEAVKLVITQYFLQHLKFGIVESQYVLAPASAFWLLLAAVFVEVPHMIDDNAFQIFYDNFWLFLLASLMGVGVNFITYFVIQFTSSLTMKILGTVRNILLIVIGVVIYQEVISVNQAIGYFIALIGFVGYNLSKMGYFEQNSILFSLLPCPGGEGMKSRWNSSRKLDDDRYYRNAEEDEEELGLLTKYLPSSTSTLPLIRPSSSSSTSPVAPTRPNNDILR